MPLAASRPSNTAIVNNADGMDTLVTPVIMRAPPEITRCPA